MFSNDFKRHFILILVLVFSLSMLPVPAFATDTSSSLGEELYATDNTDGTIEMVYTTVPSDENETKESVITTDSLTETTTEETRFAAIYQAMDAILLEYLGATVLTEDEVLEIVNTMYWADMEEAVNKYKALEPMLTDLSEEEISKLESSYSGLETFICFYNTLNLAMTPSVFANETYTPTNTNNLTVKVTNASSTSMTDNVVTITSKGSGGILGFGASAKTTTITFVNDSEDTATISFSWVATSVNNWTIDGTKQSGTSGSFKKEEIGAGESFDATITTAKNSTENKIVLSNLTLVSANASFNVTIQFDSNSGSVKADNNTVTTGDSIPVGANGITLVASPKNGASFVGWFDDNRKLQSADATYTLSTDKDLTLHAIFSQEALFLVDNILYDGLNEAITAASNSSKKTILLANTGTLKAGNYTIPSGITLVIPFDLNGTTFGSADDNSAMASTSPASTFRTLTIPSGTTITCKGTINVSGQRRKDGQPNTGTPAGKHGKIILNGSGTQLTIDSGGRMYCYGFIAGSGRVEIVNGGSMYELLQLCDWCGGSNANAWNNVDHGKNKMFVSSRYHVQNVEAPLRVNYGGTVYCEAAVTIADILIVSSAKFITTDDSTQGLFLLGSGMYLDRTYSASDDRVVYKTGGQGNVSLGAIEVELSTGIKLALAAIGKSVDLNSGSYTLPLTGSVTVWATSGTTIKLDKNVAILPGAEIIIDSGATMNLSSQMHILDIADWTASMVFSNQTYAPYTAGRGTKGTLSITESGNLTVDGTLNISGSGGIYTSVGITTSGTTSSSADKIITGTGTINHSGTLSAGALFTGYNGTSYEMKLENALANLAGIGEMKPFSTGTYYGLGPDHNNYWYQTADPTAPTCTTAGYTIYNCTGGSDSGYRVEGDPALGHSFTWEIKAGDEATLTEPATETGSCSACGSTDTRNPNSAAIGDQEYLTLQAALDNAGELAIVALKTNVSGDIIISQPVIIAFDGNAAAITAGAGYRIPESEKTSESVTIRRNPRVVSTNIALNEGLDLYFYVKASDIGPDTGDYVAVVSKDFADDREDNPVVETYSSGGWEAYPSKEDLQYYRFGFSDISAKEMTDLVTVTIQDTSGNTVISDKDGSAIESVYTQTIQNYVVTMLNHYESATDQKTILLRTALMDMLEYGAEAQVKFNYNTGNPANVENTNTLTKYSPSTDNPKSTVAKNWSKVAGVTISAKNKLLYTFYFNITNPDGFYAMVTYTHRNGEAVSERIEAEDFYKRSEGLYGVDVPYLYIADGFVALNCKLYDSSDTKIAYGTDSIAGYAERNQGTSDVYMAMMRFVNSAITYFDYKEPTT